MVRKLALALVVVAVAVGFTLSGSAQDKKKTPTIKQIMKNVNGPKGLLAKTGELAKNEKWDEAVKSAKALKMMGEALGKNKPKKGDAESWEKLSMAYAEQTEAIYKAVEAKDAEKLKEVAGTFSKACKSCHSVHK